MVDKIMCPSCHKMNDIHKFCIYCGKELPIEDNQIRLMNDNTEAYCLNCGRPAMKGQKKCECGYEFGDINCPECNTLNSYTNRFCTSCGEKLWTSNVYDYKYSESLFEKHLLKERLPYSLRNTSLYQRPNMDFKIYNLYSEGYSNSLESLISKIDKYLCKIGSRWKVVSPNYCINCINIIKSNEYSCTKCGAILFADKNRVSYLQTENKYAEPKFYKKELKWTPKSSYYYLDSLNPAIGESQFEYRERLKWEFAENNYYKKIIINRKQKEEQRIKLEEERKRKAEERERQLAERRKWEEEYIRQYGGGYCSSSCRYYYEEIIDSGGGISADYSDDMCGVDYLCSLGHFVSHGSFCKDYE
ncbi:MAG: hypothetical protein IJQ68_09720 [Methanobrevibacter sp.]|uniref:hypothetical protein n=1 Tax=Methanobrevibacter sp. TaxID=66852 RepID=UPI0025F5016D|nr:hypothetical protein [Methanobrevibacter sp.]MBR0272244.1 hypothetical protein [Methanobrevibacter sp.]